MLHPLQKLVPAEKWQGDYDLSEEGKHDLRLAISFHFISLFILCATFLA
jgi:hypothetical protein